MLIALLPMVSFMGHWGPGDLLDAVTPAVLQQHDHGAHAHAGSEEHAEQHLQHCHGRLAACSDLPYTGSATIGFLGTSILALAAALATWRQPTGSGALLRPFEPELVTPPPRLAFETA